MAIQDGCTAVLCAVRFSLSLVTFDIKFYFFLRTNVVLDTGLNLHFPGMYEEGLRSAQTAAKDQQKGLHVND